MGNKIHAGFTFTPSHARSLDCFVCLLVLFSFRSTPPHGRHPAIEPTLLISHYYRGQMLGTYNGDSKAETDGKDNSICHICSDVATGRHYGAIACNGCKGFFRRTVRRNYEYHCRFESKCEIDKHNRAVCRYCRFMKCISSGMRDDQVQSERDVIGKREKKDNMKTYCQDPTPRTSPELTMSPVEDEYDQLLESLLKSEMTIQSLRDTVITQTGNVEYTTKSKNRLSHTDRTATLNDVLKSMHSQLLLVIEWAKTLPEFKQLSGADQVRAIEQNWSVRGIPIRCKLITEFFRPFFVDYKASTTAVLLKNFAGQHVTLCVAYRSVGANDALKLLNDLYIPRASKTTPHLKEYVDGFYLRDCEKVMDQLVEPMRFLKLDNKEFVALKACVLFNPVAPGLSNHAVNLVLNARRKIFAAFEKYVRVNKPLETTRVGDLTFFILTPLSVKLFFSIYSYDFEYIRSLTAGLLLKTDDAMMSGIGTQYTTPQPHTPQFADSSHLNLPYAPFTSSYNQYPNTYS
nr:steroid/thyroid/retinoic nuclear hormone receptor homolog nhr-35 - Caenorhabditis elegans [Caenorhabditis elegans]